MKKGLILFILICIITVSLVSCKVNWFDQQYDVPWWGIVVPVILFLLVALVSVGKYIASKKYICPKCNIGFYPKWWKAAISVHINDDRIFKCPFCGKKGFCHVSKETED